MIMANTLKYSVFISHAEKDSGIVERFLIDILQSPLNIKHGDIFCTSADGHKILSGENWRDQIHDSLLSAKVIFLILTPNYIESEMCICEMGAAWVSNGLVLPLVAGLEFNQVGPIQSVQQCERLLESESLCRIKDRVVDTLEIDPSELKSDKWDKMVRNFIAVSKVLINQNPFPEPLNRGSFEKLITENKELNETLMDNASEMIEREDYIKKLESAKDRQEVNNIKEEFRKDDSVIDKFEDLRHGIVSILKRQAPLIRGVIFETFTRKGNHINSRSDKGEWSNALSRDIINSDGEADWYSTKDMQMLYYSLQEIEKVMDSIDTGIYEYITDKYKDIPYSLYNLDFWEEVFDTSISFGN